MIENVAASRHQTYELKAWEFNALLLEVVIFGGAAIGALMGLGRREFGHLLGLPDFAWWLAGASFIGIALYPVLNVLTRHERGRELRFGRWLLWEVAAAILVGLAFLLASRTWS